MARTFVALWPPADAARRLGDQAAALAAGSNARVMPACDLHITLAFIGELPGDALEPLAASLCQALERACPQTPALDDAIALDRIGSFRGANLTWLGPLAPPPWLETVADAVRSALDEAGVAFDRKPFRPHVTIARNVRLPAAELTPIVVQGWRIALVRSATGATPRGAGRYQVAAWLS